MKTTNIKSLIIISLLIVFSLSATYAFLNLDTFENSESGEGGCFNVIYTADQTIGTSSLISVNEEPTTATTEVSLRKATNPEDEEYCAIYTEASLIIYTNPTTTAPLNNPQALKYKVKVKSGDGKIKVGNELLTETTGVITKDTTGENDAANKTTLANVTLTDTETVYEIYIWIDSTISNGAYNEKTYSGYLYAESSQTSTLK